MDPEHVPETPRMWRQLDKQMKNMDNHKPTLSSQMKNKI